MLTIAFLGSLSGNALAWGDIGHQVICEVAFRLAMPATQVEIQRLINSDPVATFPDFSESCVFPDHPRIRATEHFINLPRNSAGLLSDGCPLAEKCALTAISNDRSILSAKDEPDAKRLIALESFGHWVGDIHQPLHVSFADDRGGNEIKVSGCGPDLHAVWDRCLVEYAIGLDVTKAAAGLLAAITPEMRARWTASSNPRDWANETFAVAEAVPTHYCVMHAQSCDGPTDRLTITTDYLELNQPVVKEQLQKASVRLAAALDAAFGK